MKQFAKLGSVVALAAVVLVGVPATARAGAVLTSGNGNVTVGVFDNGSIGFSGVGINLAGVGDGIFAGCLCEGWGVSTGATTGNAYGGGSFGISLVSANLAAGVFTSVTTLTGTDLQVTQAYSASTSGALILDRVTLTNTGAGTLNDVRYARNMDWDIPPTEFNEFVTIQGTSATALLYSTNDGFASSDPLTSPGDICSDGINAINADFVDSGACDHGAWFSFAFGNLDAGESHSFSIFYGATGSQASALAALGVVGAELYSFGQSNGGQITGEPGTYIFGFAGVGGTPVPHDPSAVPEPATLLLFGTGLAYVVVRLRRARRT